MKIPGVDGRTIGCIVCGDCKVLLYPHQNETNQICGLLFLCLTHASQYAGGTYVLNKPEELCVLEGLKKTKGD